MPATHQDGRLIPQFEGWIPLDWDNDKIMRGDVLVSFGSSPDGQGSDFKSSYGTPSSIYPSQSYRNSYVIYRRIAASGPWAKVDPKLKIMGGDFLTRIASNDPNEMPHVPGESGSINHLGVTASRGGYANDKRTGASMSREYGFQIFVWRRGHAGGPYRRLPANPHFITPLPLP